EAVLAGRPVGGARREHDPPWATDRPAAAHDAHLAAYEDRQPGDGLVCGPALRREIDPTVGDGEVRDLLAARPLQDRHTIAATVPGVPPHMGRQPSMACGRGME